MSYVKGCSEYCLTTRMMKKIADHKLEMSEELSKLISVEELQQYFDEVTADFVNAEGKVEKGRQSGLIYCMLKKMDKTNQLIGVVIVRRVPGKIDENLTGLKRIFADSRDTYVTEKKFFDPRFTEEEIFMGEIILNHFKDAIGFGQVYRAEYFDKLVCRKDDVSVAGLNLGRAGFSISMFIMWSLIFHNWGIGLLFALCFSTGFVIVTSKAVSNENSIETPAPQLT